MISERITLEEPSMDLVSGVVEALSESRRELAEYLVWVQSSLDDPHGNMETAIENFSSFSTELRFHIVHNATSSVLGAVGLIIRDMNVPFFEIGYWVRTSAAGNGYATEAVQLLENYAFTKLGAKRLEIRLASGNYKSRAVAERCGYFFEGDLLNERRLPSGELTDTTVFGKYGL